jgi:hypothetical protein
MGRLRDKLLAEIEEDNQKAARELVSKSRDDQYDLNSGHGGGFSRACAESGAALCKKLEAQAIRDLQGGTVRSQEALRSFHKRYEKLGNSLRLKLINQHDHR